MSWEVGDDEWLAAPVAAPGSGPVDALDVRVIQALSVNMVSRVDEGAGASLELPPEGLPPPPHSAAFDSSGVAPSFESGAFVAEQEQDPPVESEPELDFHIPVLALGVVVEPHGIAQIPADDAWPTESRAPVEPESDGFMIPTLSASFPADVAAPEDSVEEMEAEDLEEVVEAEHQPVRTGDTVVARAPVAEPESTAASITDSVYDEDDAASLVIPELVDRIDSSELEVVAEADVANDGVPAPDEEPGFVIPSLARPEASELATAHEDEEIRDDPDIATSEPGPETDPVAAAADTPSPDEPEDLADTEAIESLDSADLEELEQLVAVAAAVEAGELKPPAPPEAKPQPKRRKAWYDDVFADHFLFLYPFTWAETCERDAQFIFSQLGDNEGMSVLDVGCGDGSHAVELAKLGVRVTGLDNSLALLLAAAQNKESTGLEDGRLEFIHGDMRRLPRDREYDAVICIGTTFGYFEEEQNWLCLQEMHDRLAPGGRLLIHVFNRDFVAPHLPSRSWWQGNRCMVIDEAEMNFFANRLRVHRTIIFDDGRQYEHYMFMRAYTVQDLGRAISQLGMRVIQVSGSRDTVGRFYGSASPDIWIVAEKK